MKIISHNLHNYMESDRYTKLDLLAKEIVNLDVDVICLQEVGQFYLDNVIENGIKSSNLALILQNILEKKYGIKYHLSVEMFKLGWNIYDEGLAILSKEEHHNVELIPLSNDTSYDNWETRYCLKAEYKNLTLCNIHLGWDSEQESAMKQFHKVYDLDFKNPIYLGDFNLEMGSEYYNYITNNLKDVIYEYDKSFKDTLTIFSDERTRIDYAFSNCVKLCDVKYLFERDNPISDHVVIYMESE